MNLYLNNRIYYILTNEISDHTRTDQDAEKSVGTAALQAFLHLSVMLPPNRFRQLLEQAFYCTHHNTQEKVTLTNCSLLSDHMCSKEPPLILFKF
ncbi:hypothetical protein ABEB36_002242 [Hypothenemus hampei]|uniref:Uncharacterized protein n=1 Tax=Hypothenemus hampei TaxID=57062 RepID=A0ABD1F7L5_HYPHA